MHGGCLCGGVRFEVTEQFGGATTMGRVAAGAIRIVDGTDLLRTYQPDEGSAKTFCSVCGSNLFGAGWPATPFAAVRLTALSSGLGQMPNAHIFVRSVAPWEILPEDGLPRFDVRPS